MPSDPYRPRHRAWHRLSAQGKAAGYGKGQGGQVEACSRCQKSWFSGYLACDLEQFTQPLWSALPDTQAHCSPEGL